MMRIRGPDVHSIGYILIGAFVAITFIFTTKEGLDNFDTRVKRQISK